jgi:GWxTD domain-containing protein
MRTSVLSLVSAILVMSFIVVPQLPGQTIAEVALETNRFYTSQGQALVEGAVEVPYPLLTFVPQGDLLRAHAKVEVIIENGGGQSLYQTEHDIEPEAMNSEMAASDRVSSIETFAVYAPPGEYTVRSRVTDLGSGRTYEETEPLVVLTTPPLFSDVVLARHVQKDIQLSEGAYMPYLIGTTMFNPNPRSVFYKDAPLVYFYYEINPATIGEATGEVVLEMAIQDASGQVIKSLGERRITVTASQNFDLGAFNVGGLVPGEYDLVFRCTSCSGSLSTTKRFEVRPPHAEQLVFLDPPAALTTVAAGDYAGLSEAQIDSVIQATDILFTQSQRQLVATLNPTGKVEFLNRFWQSQDPDPSTPVNEFKEVFAQRIAYADQFYTSSQRLGRDTDRGRIYIMFGEPTEVIDRPFEAQIGPYQIWNYSSQGKTFAYGDFRKDGDYHLIYSTDRRFPGDPQIQPFVDDEITSAQANFIRPGRGLERIIEDIKLHRVTSGPGQ